MDHEEVAAVGRNQVGICVLRVWRYGDRTLVRVWLQDDVERSGTERVVLTAEAEEALGAVHAFLDNFADQ